MFKFFEVFRKGRELTHAATWKKSGVAVTLVAPVLGFLVKDIAGLDVTDDQVMTVTLGIVTVVNVVLPFATSKKIGLSAEGEE